MAGIT